MSFLNKLLGKRAAGTAGKQMRHPKSLKEKDNMGTRHNTASLATTYWIARMASSKKDPYVMYIFDNANGAHTALLELPCIHVAEDTGNLICTDVLIFGYYQT